MNAYGTIYRNALLPLFERVLKGRATIAYWAQAERSQWKDRKSLETQQLIDLKALLLFAHQHCVYYREQWSCLGLDPSKIQSFDDFHAWPLLTRQQIQANRMSMRSSIAKKLITKSTGGSTGQPLVFDLDPESNERRTAMMYRGYGWAHSGPGARRLLIWGADLARTSLWKSIKVQLHHAFEQQTVLNCFDFSHSNMRAHFNAMQRYRPETIIAYTGPIFEFARFLKTESLKPTGIRSIVVGAEKLHSFQRELIEEVFGAPVFETYGSREFMLIGAECERHQGMHLSMENLLVEVLDDDGAPTPPGDEGNVVITDLFNRGMPFIRYVNGDRAIAGFNNCECGRGLPLLSKVVGRQLDVIYTAKGKAIPGELFPHLFKDFEPVRQFQVQQHRPDQIEIKIVTSDAMCDEMLDQIQSRIAECLNNEIQVRFDRVDSIPMTAAGKRQVVINHLPRKQVPQSSELKS